jgi:hypothetical protein
MADKKKVNELEQTMQGCYGETVTHEELVEFLDFNFGLNDRFEQAGTHRFAQCIWGHAGIGKTEQTKTFRKRPVEWRGKKYDGWDVRDVPIAQFEEMGDLHGIPSKCSLMKSADGKDERWVADEHITDYKSEGWKIDIDVRPCTRMAAPDWVPIRPGPSILLLDDWNRASVRIIKGIMQLLQNYGMVSWQLPPGCNIVLTGNPDEQDYMVTSIDNAILTRIKHVTLKPDATEWAVWAEANKLDPRGINFILHYPEMMLPHGEAKRSNPRTLAEFFRVSKCFPNVDADKKTLALHAHSLLDEETVAAWFVYVSREMEMVVEPEQILNGDKKSREHIEKLMDRKEPRTDILNVICERLYARMVQADCETDKDRIKNFQTFITMKCIPEDTRHSLCRRIAKKRDNPAMQKWLIGSKELRDLIMETIR